MAYNPPHSARRPEGSAFSLVTLGSRARNAACPGGSPIVFVQLILPLELPTAHHAVIPEHQAPRDLLMELSGQVLKETGRVPHGGQLQGEDKTLGEAQRGWSQVSSTGQTGHLIPPKEPWSQKPLNPTATEGGSSQMSDFPF